MTSVGVIGPGRVGTALAGALKDAGWRVVAVAGRGAAAVERFVAAVPAAEVMPAEQVARSADVVLLTVGDDELAPLGRALAAADVVDGPRRWLHTSGRWGAAVLRPIALAGGRVAACHPAQTFPTPAQGRAALAGCAWAVTAADADRGWAHEFVKVLGGHPVDVGEGDRVRYHAGLVVASNGTSAVVALARDLLLSAGIAAPERFLAGLATQSAANAAAHGAAALTGPVRRGDHHTVRAHLDDLQVTLPEAIPAYLTLARLALSYARRAGLDDERAAQIDAILQAGR